MKKIVIEMMTVDDIDNVVEVENNCFSIPWSKASFLREVENNEIALYLVAKIENKAVGYIGVWRIIDEGHITNVAVHSDYRGLGIGSMLVSELLSLCKKDGINSFTLEVRKSNEIAQKLYRKYGFEERGIRKKYYEDNKEDAVIMWLD
jgi:ribosomal-protein-alanine N-acetyltransferase